MRISAVIPVQVTAQDGDVRLPVPLVPLRLGPGEAAVQGHALHELKAGGAIASIGRGVVDAPGDPDLIAGFSRGQGILQVYVRIVPRRAVVVAVGLMVDVDGSGRRRTRDQSGD